MNMMLKKLFVKYVIGECRHLCFMCKYKTECDCNYEETDWKYLWKYFIIKRYNAIKRLHSKLYDCVQKCIKGVIKWQ